MNHSFEEREAIAAEEAAIRAKHRAAENAAANYKKNAKLYEKMAKEGQTKIWRQCPAGVDPIRYTLSEHAAFTFCRYQYFNNNKGSGSAAHVIKAQWSTHPDPNKAMNNRYQTEAFFKLRKGREITRLAKQHLGTEVGSEVAAFVRSHEADLQVAADHPIQNVLFGFCSVYVEKGGTKLFKRHLAVLIPNTVDGQNIANVTFYIDDAQFDVELIDTASGKERGNNASLMVGYMRGLTETEQMTIIAQNFAAFKNKSKNENVQRCVPKCSTVSTGAPDSSELADLHWNTEASELCADYQAETAFTLPQPAKEADKVAWSSEAENYSRRATRTNRCDMVDGAFETPFAQQLSQQINGLGKTFRIPDSL
jgi:hypothetical protein